MKKLGKFRENTDDVRPSTRPMRKSLSAERPAGGSVASVMDHPPLTSDMGRDRMGRASSPVR
jgi:hypothetical protein